MVDFTLSLPGLSPVRCKPLDVRFDGGVLSPDGGLLVFREVEERLRLADRLAGCLKDPRNQGQVDHTLAEIIRFRMLAIVAGYEDGNDCNTLRHDPIFKIALGRLPERGENLCSQSTVSRLENLPSRPDLYRMARWSTSTARPFHRFRIGSCSIWTILSMPLMAPNNFNCSMPTTTSTASSRL